MGFKIDPIISHKT